MCQPLFLQIVIINSLAGHNSKYYSKKSDFSKLDWNLIKTERWDDSEDGKRKRMAEFLVLNEVEPYLINKIYVKGEAYINHLKKYKKDLTLPEIRINLKKFF